MFCRRKSIMLKCDKCPYMGPSSHLLKSHQRHAHSDLKPWICNYPGCAFRTKSVGKLNSHKKRKHEPNEELRKPYACKFDNCEYRATYKHQMNSHVWRKHTSDRSRNFQCPLCPSRFYSEAERKKHISLHTREGISYECKYCKFKTHAKHNLANHMKNIHEKLVKFSCSFPGCNHSTVHGDAFQRHLQTHDPDPQVRRPFPCKFPKCECRASSAAHLNRHINVRHNPSRAKEFACALCSKTFYTRSIMRTHITAVHTNEQFQSCDICHYEAWHAGSLKHHYERVHRSNGERGKRKLACPSCHVRTETRRKLDFHQRTVHNGERSLSCKHRGCNYKTNHSTLFQKHLLLHEDDPKKQFPFSCSFPTCDYRVRSKANMNTHKRMHQTSKVQLKCQSCRSKYCFPDRKSLEFHRCMIHDEGKCYKCTVCNYICFWKLSLTRHIHDVHNDSSNNSRNDVVALNAEARQTGAVAKISNEKHSQTISKCQSPTFVVSDEFSAFKHRVQHRVPIVLLDRITIKIM